MFSRNADTAGNDPSLLPMEYCKDWTGPVVSVVPISTGF